MGTEVLTIYGRPKLTEARMILGFTGWMDGGEVSIGTIDYLISRLDAAKLADIDPSMFYLYNFPGSMDVASLFRPHVKIEQGLITAFQEPVSTFHCAAAHNVILFKGKEPNLRWREYAECILSVAAAFHVKTAYFVGSVAGMAPHTRDPRIFTSASTEKFLAELKHLGLEPSDYEGPASFVTYLTALGKRRDLEVGALVAEIPAYVQAKNVKCILAIVRKLVALLDLTLDVNDLKLMSKEFDRRLNETVQERPDLDELIQKIEADYDKQLFGADMDDELKAWLERQGIRLE